MKVAIISDLHLFHWDNPVWKDSGFYPVTQIKKSLERNKPDLILDAGDYEIDIDWGVKSFKIPGNHDYYGKTWHEDNWWKATKSFKYNDVRIAMTTLWTDLNNNDDDTKRMYYSCLMDCSAIRGFSPDIAYQTHVKQKTWLENEARDELIDIVVTHHTPSFKSVHQRYLGKDYFGNESLVNYGFSSHLDDLVKKINPKIWIHGHTHDSFDYKLGDTRIICNPCGYPSERGSKPYKVTYVSI